MKICWALRHSECEAGGGGQETQQPEPREQGKTEAGTDPKAPDPVKASKNAPEATETSETGKDTPEALQARVVALNKELEDMRAREKEQRKEARTIEEELEQKKREADRLRIAYEMGVPFELAKRLTGETAEEIKKDAIELLEVIGRPSEYVAPLAKPSGTDERQEAYRKLARMMQE